MKTQNNTEFLRGLAEAAVRLFVEDGNLAPTPEQILDEYWDMPCPVPSVLLDTAKDQIGKITRYVRNPVVESVEIDGKTVTEETRPGYTVVPIDADYYVERDKVARGKRGPLNRNDLSNIIAGGRGSRQAGILFLIEDDDFSRDAYIYYMGRSNSIGQGILRSTAEQNDRAVSARLIEERTAKALTVEQVDRTKAPFNPYALMIERPGPDGEPTPEPSEQDEAAS